MKSKLILASTIMALFGAYFTINTPAVSAASDARKDCSNPQNTEGQQLSGERLDVCIKGYNGAYPPNNSSPRLMSQACGDPERGKSVEGITYGNPGTYTVCVGGYGIGTEKSKQDNPGKDREASDEDKKSASREACDRAVGPGDSSDDCVRGYTVASKKNSTAKEINAECGQDEVNGKKKDAIDKDYCQQGAVLAGADEEEVTSGRKVNKDRATKRAAAKEACDKANVDKDNLKACIAGYLGQQDGKSKDETCKAYDGEKKKACETGFETGATTKQADNPDCDVSLSSPLSWIICPVVDLGANFTDFVFRNFVRGLLEDVPVTTESNNGSYLAWKQFRILGNIVLVGTLLAVVYAQARGGK